MTVSLILRDGARIGIAEHDDAGLGVLAWFHANLHGASMAHYLEHEGYSVETLEDVDCHDVESLIAAICKRTGVTMESTFVPFSQSRHAKGDKPWRSLNWEITIKRHGRHVGTAQYAQGEGFAPASKANPIAGGMRGHSASYTKALRNNAISREIETGRIHNFGDHWQTDTDGTRDTRKPIPAPSIGDVMQSLARDCDVLDAGGFEQWAGELGYDTDSRAAESTYQACLEIAMKLRAGLGEKLLAEIRLAALFN